MKFYGSWSNFKIWQWFWWPYILWRIYGCNRIFS